MRYATDLARSLNVLWWTKRLLTGSPSKGFCAAAALAARYRQPTQKHGDQARERFLRRFGVGGSVFCFLRQPGQRGPNRAARNLASRHDN